MTTYNTGNPIGSKDPRDLYDNAENLDEAVNTRTAESWDDRFGVARKTWWGMEQNFQQFLINSGYENIGDYGPGLEITARNQIFWRDGELYRAGAVLELPYTTTGDWGDEEGLFVAVGDQSLRQELLDSTDPENGAAMVASSSVVVDSVAALQNIAIPTARLNASNQIFRVLDYHGGWAAEGRLPRGGGEFRYVPDSELEVDGGVVLNGPAGIGRFVRLITDYVSPDFWGALGDGVADDTQAIQSAVSYYPINEDDVGVITPKGFANGGRVRLSRGRYKITQQIVLNRGLLLQGEGKESTQLISFSPDGVLVYHDKGRYHPDELRFEDFSIWQDESVVPTGGAGIAVIDTGLVPVAALTPTFANITIEGTYVGIRLNLLIGAAIRDCLISKCVSHGAAIEGTSSSTSTTIQNTYAQQNGGSGFFVDTAAYISFISTASDSNGSDGYDIRRVKNVAGVAAGAEVNRYQASFLQCEGVNWNCYGIGNSNGGILLDRCRKVMISGHLDGEVGTGVIISAPTGPTVIAALTLRGNYAANPHNNAEDLIVVGNAAGEILTTRGVIRMLSSSGPIIRAYPGNPEGGITAPPGSLLMRSDSAGGLYVKETGVGNTGWVKK